ncbi:MAG: NADH-quinone oxidoreductase subunit N [Candidatus Eisenbacteria bacterium]|uniref:NADH-quinone oxidoreductase subunit N n=1 Tax=Eiseniibacteriota bacterium TaxID=2212470 RepID=A0A933SCU6_UNCEI|nr:NADH-quinone oxidoreductase subunit N [Candidatus Eisenbacteria bacterium]
MSIVPQPTFLALDWWALGPVLALTAGTILLLLLEFLPQRANGNRGGIVSLLTFLASGYAVWRVAGEKRELFGGMFVHDPMTVFFTLLFCAVGVLATLMSWDYLKRTKINQAEYYALLLSSVLGMVVMAASNDLVTVFLGLELMSLALYVMVGFRRSQLESNEASLKYFLLGAFASGFLLYGIALLYGATGSSNLAMIGAFLADTPLATNPMLLMGSLLVFVGFAFKVAAAPFHMWTPDVYEGAPTSVTGFMSAGAKAAGFAALLRVALRALGPVMVDWTQLLAVIAFLTMTVGNVTALLQGNLKRMLAYSSIAHAGYILVAVAAGGPEGASAAVFYLATYSFMNIGAFAVLTMLGKGREERVLMSDLAGLGFREPLLGLALTAFMLSLAGIPPMAGFMGKLYIFGEAVKHPQLLWVVVAGVLNSVVSVYYYLRVTVSLYMKEPEGEPVGISWGAPAVLAIVITLAATLWFGLQAQGLWIQAQNSVMGLL